VSVKGMLKQRASVRRLQETDQDGAPVYSWIEVVNNVPCMADTFYARAFSRLGQRGGYRNQGVVKEAQRIAGRSGLMSLPLGTDVKPGDRVVITSFTGDTYGTFETNADLQFILDRSGRPHHLEVGISEVARPLGRM
jgi:hypothetical protein